MKKLLYFFGVKLLSFFEIKENKPSVADDLDKIKALLSQRPITHQVEVVVALQQILMESINARQVTLNNLNKTIYESYFWQNNSSRERGK